MKPSASRFVMQWKVARSSNSAAIELPKLGWNADQNVPACKIFKKNLAFYFPPQ
jgi:imidazoleglycerol phosphate synthase glutamine amidotransferase subunit HisH